jgi:hypothetical protein
MNQSSATSLRWLPVLALVAIVLATGCDELPANFWSDKAGEVVNRSIFAAINAVLAAVTGGTVVL